MGVLAKIFFGLLGLCLLVPGLCFGFFGLGFTSSVRSAGIAALLLGGVWLAIAGLLIWGAITIFRELGR